MPSQFSAIGFDVSSGEDLAALASHVAERADTITVPGGQYLKWSPPSGEQLWLQLKANGDAMGMNPHFGGRSAVRVLIESRVTRASQTPLDGSFIAWANPAPDAASGGEYPFVFDCPDAARHEARPLPLLTTAQIAAFAQQLSCYASEAAYDRTRAEQGLPFSSRSFIPSGLISPNGEPVDPPEPHALFVGHVIEAAALTNSVSGHPYWWALTETHGGTFDVVIDPHLLDAIPRPGNVLSGWFWLSGRLAEASAAKPGWLRRMTGR